MKTQIVALFVGLTWSFLPQITVAEPETTEDSDSAKAAIRFQRAVDLYREGSYEGALAEFQKAYQISPAYRVLYNIAQAQNALHDFVGAYKTLIQYLTEGGSEIPVDRRAQVAEMSARLQERIAHVQISTNLPGADIRVDDVAVGTSPLPGPVSVNVGTRRVSASKAGSPEAVRLVTVAGRESVKVELLIDEPIVASARLAPSKESQPAPLLATSQPQAASGRTGLIVSLCATAALGVGTGVFGYLALGAQKDLNDQVNTYPNTRSKIEDARSKSKHDAYVTDALGAATLVSGGVALYFALSHRRDSPTAGSGRSKSPIVVAPTVGGMVVEGSF